MARTRHVALTLALLAGGCSALIDSDEVRFEAPASRHESGSTGREPLPASSEDSGRSPGASEADPIRELDEEEARDAGVPSQPPDSGTTMRPATHDSGPPDAQVPLDAAFDAGIEDGTPPPPPITSPLAPELIMTSLHVMR